MLDDTTLSDCLNEVGLGAWRSDLQQLLAERFSTAAHGDFAKWQAALDELRATTSEDSARRRELLLSLAPWRKGPFDLDGIHIDSEWRSNLKWDRLSDRITSLEGRNVLDVGCGNGFYALQMREAGANCVVGIDPTLLYVMQFLAVQVFIGDPKVVVLPLRSDELPPKLNRFDTTFSMGVLYHQRSPIEHLRLLRDTLRPGGELVLETLFVPGEESFACTPADRYARMRNVWLLPTINELKTWLARTGYLEIEVIDRSVTTIDEQRSTEWMAFDSLAEALDPTNPELTIEGWPAPRRVIVLAKSP